MQPTFRKEKGTPAARPTSEAPGIQMTQAAFEQALQRGARYDSVKRILDVILASAALILLSPVLVLLSVLICIDDAHGGPFYVSSRIGKNGRPFRFYKFRSMCVNADEQLEDLLEQNEADGPAFKMREDPRITRIGRILRKYSLDELPQLINVIKGDMSIVGPRPPLPREVDQYSAAQMRRLAVRPGLTCYWQVQPRRNDLSFDEWLALDLKYIRERGLWVDIRLVARTIGVMFVGEGI